jgi:hypothetical protein
MIKQKKFNVRNAVLFSWNFSSSFEKSCTAHFGSPDVPEENNTKPGCSFLLLFDKSHCSAAPPLFSHGAIILINRKNKFRTGYF